MASTIKVDNVQNQPGTNIINKCSVTTTIGAGAGETVAVCAATVNLGRSGGTVNLTSGATQTGFGRTGTVNWNTTPVTSTPTTGVSGSGYFVNSTGAIKTINFPASPSAGDIMAVADYAGTAGTYVITIGRNGSNVEGVANDAAITSNRDAVTFVYVDGVQGWVPVNDNESSAEKNILIAATGGTPCAGAIVCTDYKVHTFTGPGTFCVSAGAGPVATVDYMVIAGGAGGGGCMGGGGGAGGYRESPGTASGCYAVSPLGVAPAVALPVSITGYPITVGGGGPGGGPGTRGTIGVNSVFSTITSAGGGGGGAVGPGGGADPSRDALDGGSGGGQRAGWNPAAGPVGGSGNTPPVSPPQGNTGGKGYDGVAISTNGGGGGASSAVGGDGGYPSGGGNGAAGVTSSITASPVQRAAGGGGGSDNAPEGSGGAGGGGASAAPTGVAGATNTGSGGGGGSNPNNTGGAGGSGIVVIRYKFQ